MNVHKNVINVIIPDLAQTAILIPKISKAQKEEKQSLQDKHRNES